MVNDTILILSGLPGGSVVEYLLANKRRWFNPWLEDPLEKEMAAHSRILTWENPWTEEPGGLSPWSHKQSDMT